LIRGQIDDADITIRGTWDQPVLEGEAVVKHAQYDGIILSDIPVSFRIVLDREDDPLRISGPVDMTGGNIQTRRTKVVLENSKIAFEGDSRNPTLNIKGSAKVDKVNIRIAVTGTKETPEVNLTSTPSLPQEQLLVMLATGQRWQGVETALKQGQLSMDVTRDFVDYFFFGGTGSKLAEKYGIEEFNVTFEKDKKGFGIKKKITNGLKVDYAVEQMQQDTAQKTTEQSVGAEVNLTDNLSVDARKDLPVGPNDQPLTTAPAKDEIYLKYKKSF